MLLTHNNNSGNLLEFQKRASCTSLSVVEVFKIKQKINKVFSSRRHVQPILWISI